MDPITILFIAYLSCDDAAERVVLPPTVAMECVQIYEELKRQVADGDYLAFIEWREDNEADYRERHRIPNIIPGTNT